MPSVGPKSPTAAVNRTGVGTQAWSNPTNALASDDTNAVVNPTDTGVAYTSNYLYVSGFDFSTVPSTATIDGILVEIEKRESQASNDAKDVEVKLVDDTNTIRTTNKADTVTEWGTTDAYASYGGSSDLWGEAAGFWTPAKVKDADFGVVIAGSFTSGGTSELRVDHVRVTVTYTDSATSLVIQNGAHAHAAGNLALTQVHVLAVNNAAHAHTAGNVVLVTALQLVIANALHAHSAGSLTLTQVQVLTIQNSRHAHTSAMLGWLEPDFAEVARVVRALRKRPGGVYEAAARWGVPGDTVFMYWITEAKNRGYDVGEPRERRTR